MRQSADEIRQDMREEARAHAARMAQRKARETLTCINAALTTPTVQMAKLLYATSEEFNRQNVRAVLRELDELRSELETYMTLLSELDSPVMLPEPEQAPAAQEKAA